jgi:putative flippase GtrA
MRLPAPLDAFMLRLLRAARNRALRRKAIIFALIGAVNFAVDFGIFTFAYYRLGLPIITANIAAWCVAVSGSYVLNSLITFAAESGRRLRVKDYATFVVSQTGGLVANTVTVFVASFFIPVLLGKALAIGASFVVNFSLTHFVVFRHPRPSSRDAAS